MERIFLPTFIILYAVMMVCHVAISLLNAANVRSKGTRVPGELESVINLDTLSKANKYSLSKLYFGVVRYAVDKAILLVFILAGILAWYAGLLGGINNILAGLLFFGGLFLASFLLSIPFSYYGTFVIEQRFGFNTSGLGTWIGDIFKELLIGCIMGGLLLLGVLLLVQYLPQWWWVFAWLLVFAFSLFTMFIYPVVIVPLFNKLTPVEGPLAERIREMAEQVGIRVKSVSQIDASKRSKHVNAYFAGLGRTKHIVLFDTLVNTHTDDEIVGVLAHEMGHWKYRHGFKQLLVMQIVMFLAFLLAGWLLREPLIYDTLGIGRAQFYAGLLVIMVVFEIPSFFLSPIFKSVSRLYERRADRFAVSLTGDKEAFSSSLRRLAQENLTNLFPHPLYVYFFYSHPPVLERLDYIKRLK